MKKSWHISYNAPVSITYAVLCALILLFDHMLSGHLMVVFTAPGSQACPAAFNPSRVLDYFRLFTHVFGHADWTHFLNNFAYILLLGPLMEERYGSAMVALMMTITALVTGVINACVIPASLLGASGIAFMLILLASLSTIEKNEIPVSFLLVLAIFLGREFVHTTRIDTIATFAHIAGGLCGSLFGFLVAPKQRQSKKTEVISARSEKSARSKKIPAWKAAAMRDDDDDRPARSTSPYSPAALRERARKARLEQIDNSSPRYRSGTSSQSSTYTMNAPRTPYDAVPTSGPTENESEVLGTLEL